MMATTYPFLHDELQTPFASPKDRDRVTNALQRRVGTLEDSDPASLEDRLYTVENLIADLATRIFTPPGQGKKA